MREKTTENNELCCVGRSMQTLSRADRIKNIIYRSHNSSDLIENRARDIENKTQPH